MLSKKILSVVTLENSIYLLISLVTMIFVINKDVICFPDSEGYSQMALFRSCGYPLFIAFHQYLFGENFISILIFTQFLATLFASLFLLDTIRESVNLNKWLAYILFVALLLPLISGIKSANSILSEAIAYPLYLYIIGNILLGMINKQNKNFYYSFILTFILILVRGQFLFIVPVLLIAVFLTYGNFIFNKKHLFLIVSIVAIPFLAISTDVIYHKLRHNQAVTTPWTGIQVVTIPFFVSDKDDYLLFDNKVQQEYFKYIYTKLEQKKLLLNQIPQSRDKIDFFHKNYCNICNFTINDDGVKFFNEKLSDEEKIILNDKMTSSITITLINNNFVKWITIYKSNVIEGFGELKDLFLILILLFLSFFMFFKKKQFISKLIILFSFLTIGNIALVAIAESLIERYTFYNHWIVIAIFLILFQNLLQNKTNE
jgi:O-antigen ligase